MHEVAMLHHDHQYGQQQQQQQVQYQQQQQQQYYVSHTHPGMMYTALPVAVSGQQQSHSLQPVYYCPPLPAPTPQLPMLMSVLPPAIPAVTSQIQVEPSLNYAVDVYLWKYAMQQTAFNPQPLSLQSAVTPPMRATLLSWLAAVNRQFNFSLETFCITASLLDRFVTRQPLHPDCLQLAGLAAFFLASKLEEVDPPELKELVTVCAGAFTKQQFRLMERIMLEALGFRLVSATPAFFLDHLAESEGLTATWPVDFTRHLLERCLCQYELCQVLPSRLAHAVLTVIVEHYYDARLHDSAFGGVGGAARELTKGHEEVLSDYMKRLQVALQQGQLMRAW